MCVCVFKNIWFMSQFSLKFFIAEFAIGPWNSAWIYGSLEDNLRKFPTSRMWVLLLPIENTFFISHPPSLLQNMRTLCTTHPPPIHRFSCVQIFPRISPQNKFSKHVCDWFRRKFPWKWVVNFMDQLPTAAAMRNFQLKSI